MFLNRPSTTDTGKCCRGRVLYRLNEDLIFETQLNGFSGLRIVVPAGFETDLGSTPCPIWCIFPPFGQWSPATILHDYLYGLPDVSRFLADALFREAMAQLGVPVWRRVIVYYFVRLFGGSHCTSLEQG